MVCKLGSVFLVLHIKTNCFHHQRVGSAGVGLEDKVLLCCRFGYLCYSCASCLLRFCLLFGWSLLPICFGRIGWRFLWCRLRWWWFFFLLHPRLFFVRESGGASIRSGFSRELQVRQIKFSCTSRVSSMTLQPMECTGRRHPLHLCPGRSSRDWCWHLLPRQQAGMAQIVMGAIFCDSICELVHRRPILQF